MEQYCTFSAPGRVELGGNHTDHQRGLVLAAAVSLDVRAQVRLNGTSRIRVQSEGYPPFEIALKDLSPKECERNTSAALVRGVVAAFAQQGAPMQGFDMSIHSDVPPGSGLSSSAAFEVLVATVCNALFFDGQLDAVAIARICQHAETVYFGKPCGLMDQMASSMGGLVYIDFAEATPAIERIDFDFAKAGYALCIIHTNADHSNLTEEYAAIPRELKQLCAIFGKEYLRELPETDFMAALPQLRGQVSDRAILRAIHVYQENRRVAAQADALKRGDIDNFLNLVNTSGRSSWMYLQNITPPNTIHRQPIAFALALCDTLLQGQGACRVHGGGFAGTVQAFVPLAQLERFKTAMDQCFGQDACQVLSIRSHGGIRLD